MPAEVLTAALACLDAGLSIIPCNGVKKPCLDTWKPYQTQQASLEQIKKWFSSNGNRLAVVCGKVSGGLEVLDFDDRAAFDKWGKDLLDTRPDLFQKLVFEKSPHGVHCLYQCSEIQIPGNQKLALSVDKKVLIETRGEGGYCLIAPSQGYRLERGSFTALPDISAADRQILLELARALNEQPERIEKGYQENRTDRALLPGQDFDARGDIRPYLIEAGWQSRGQDREGRERWARPGKDSKGHSATLTDGKVFYCFSSNGAPFDTDRGYGPFATYALLKHQGDFTEAARELSRQGYGSRASQEPERVSAMKTQKNRDVSALVREYLEFFDGGVFKVSDLKRELNLSDSQYVLARQCVRRMVGKELEKHGKGMGIYRLIDRKKSCIDWDSTEAKPCNLVLPGGLHKIATIRSGDSIALAAYKNHGKSAFAIELIKENLDRFKIHFFITEYKARMKQRLLDFGVDLNHPNLAAYQIEKSDYLPDKIEPGEGVLNVIDHYPNLDNFYLAGKVQDEIHRRLDGALALITHQKKNPDDLDAIGGSFWTITPTLAITTFMDDRGDFPGRMLIRKGKEPRGDYTNINGLQIRYKLTGGCQFTFDERGWRHERYK
jgi:hypothetical protein